MRTDEEVYLLDNAWELARARFEGLEQASDAETFAGLESVGVAPGWACLEPGPGSGSVAAWLARRVAPSGRVTAVDLDPRWVPRDVPGLDVVQADVRAYALPDAHYDLVHTRAFLVHLAARDELLARFARALKPGGVALLEEPDWSTDASAPGAPAPLAALYDRVMPRLLDLLAERGMAIRFGLGLAAAAQRAGLTVRKTRAYTEVVRGATAASRFEWLTFIQCRDLAVGAGVASAEEFQDFLDLFRNPDFAYVRPLICCVAAERR